MKLRYIIAVTAALSVSATAFAGDESKAFDKNCKMCHAVSTKIMGPSLKTIVEKHKGQADAPAKLEAAVRNGSKGVYGPAEMPKKDAKAISDADLKAAVAYILSTK